MTLVESLVFVLFMATVPVALAVISRVNRWAVGRAITAILLVGLGLNTQFTAHPWQSWVLLLLATVAAGVPTHLPRWPALVLLALGGPFLLQPRIAIVASEEFFAPQRIQILLVSSGFLLSVLAGSLLVEQLLGRIKGLPHSSEDAENTTGAPAGGRIIGMLERAFAYGGVLVGHPEAAALVVAVKSVARFPEFSKANTGRKFAEYFLIGTLLSIGFALAIGYLINAALTRTP